MRFKIVVVFLMCCVPTLVFSNIPKRFLDRPEVHTFISEMETKHHLSKPTLVRYFARARFQEPVLTAIAKPYEAKPWPEYRKLFITDTHVQNGVRFYQAHKELLQRAEASFGVPAEIIVAILGVETRYGENTGKFSVFESLSTLAFGYPPRAAFFRKELEQYLLLSREEGFDPLSLKGSYAGAMGVPQFMPSSYRQYAVDFNTTGKRDLLHEWGAIIGSVANYFKENGWAPGQAVAVPAKLDRGTRVQPSKEAKPKATLAELARLGIHPAAEGPSNTTKGALITLEDPSAPEYWVGFNNFYVITRYNRSNNYAMAVFQLSEAIKKGIGS